MKKGVFNYLLGEKTGEEERAYLNRMDIEKVGVMKQIFLAVRRTDFHFHFPTDNAYLWQELWIGWEG